MSLRISFSKIGDGIARAVGAPCRKAFEAVAFKTKPGRFISRQFVKNHNKIQFFGYEPPNVILAVNDYVRRGASSFGLHEEGYAAMAFLVGSGAIYHFDFKKRPTRLLWGGLGLTAGGAFIAAAGYPVSGVPIAIASLETARGGLSAIKSHIEKRNAAGEAVAMSTKFSYHAGRIILAPYKLLMEKAVGRIPGAGEFLNERPFVAGTAIKSPPRLDYIYQKGMEGDAVAAGVGAAWLLVGDVALTFNDPKLRAYFERELEKNTPPGTGEAPRQNLP